MYKLVFSSFSDDYCQLNRDLCDAVSNTNQILDRENETLSEVLRRVEGAESKEDIGVGFEKINDVMRFFLRVAPGRKEFKSVREEIKKIGISDYFEESLMSSHKLEDVILKWKMIVLQNLSAELKQKETEDTDAKRKDAELISRFFPHTNSNNQNADVKSKIYTNSRKRQKVSKISKRSNFSYKEFQIMKRKRFCYHFQTNNCHKGNMCKFKHVKF